MLARPVRAVGPLVFLLAGLASAGPAPSPCPFTPAQWAMVRLGYKVGAPEGWGFKLAGVGLQETRAGAGRGGLIAQGEPHIPEFDRSRGVWQVRPSTAADLWGRYTIPGALTPPVWSEPAPGPAEAPKAYKARRAALWATWREAWLRQVGRALLEDPELNARTSLAMFRWLGSQGLNPAQSLAAYPLGLEGFRRGLARGWLEPSTYAYAVGVRDWAAVLERDPTCRAITTGAAPIPRPTPARR